MQGKWVEMVDRETLKRIMEKKHSYVLFSGGKDSLCALALVKEIASEMSTEVPVTAIHVDTTVSLPDNLKYVEEICERLDVPLVVLSPKEDFFTLAKRIGAPRFNARWCCFALKIKPIQEYLRSQPPGKLVFDGVRNEESSKRRRYRWYWYDRRHFKCFIIHPIIDWTEAQVLNFLNQRNLPLNPLYKKFRRATECWCGVFKSRRDFELLKAHNPELFRKLLDVERSFRRGSFGKHFFLEDIDKQQLIDRWISKWRFEGRQANN